LIYPNRRHPYGRHPSAPELGACGVVKRSTIDIIRRAPVRIPEIPPVL